ncbi:MAG: hypothetical protein U9Q89_04925 [Thermodesulfobacteriota bacterium]|nr:hypothetical protein [Thermodesulfobacteriota bacterium]
MLLQTFTLIGSEGAEAPVCPQNKVEMLSDFEGKRMIVNYFGHSGNDLKSGKLSSGMGGRFRPESPLDNYRQKNHNETIRKPKE